MHTLRVPSGRFALAALAASERAGFLGSLMLLCRRLDPGLERELRQSWSDLDDLTHSDLLVLVTGLQARPGESRIVSDRRGRHVLAKGISLARNRSGEFDRHLDDLLEFTAPTPTLPDGEKGDGRLIDAEGVTEIRRALGIGERELPVLLVRSHAEAREVVICLGEGTEVFSPARIISEIVIHLDEARQRLLSTKQAEPAASPTVQVALPQPGLPELDPAAGAMVVLDLGRLNALPRLLAEVKKKLEGRARARAQDHDRMVRVLMQAPARVKASGEVVLSYLAGTSATEAQAAAALEELAQHLKAARPSQTENRFLSHLRKRVHHRRQQQNSPGDSDRSLLKAQQSYERELASLEAALEASRQRAAAAAKLAEVEASTPAKSFNLEGLDVLQAVEAALSGLGFQLVTGPVEIQPSPGTKAISRSTYARNLRGHSARSGSDAGLAHSFDVFLSHNTQEKETVVDLARRLKSQGLRVWYDEWELVPGRSWQQLLEAGIRRSRTVAVLVGRDGLGPWEKEEMEAALTLAVRNHKPVIPVLLPGTGPQPELPLFLGTRMWVDLRKGATDQAMAKLLWGITGVPNTES